MSQSFVSHPENYPGPVRCVIATPAEIRYRELYDRVDFYYKQGGMVTSEHMARGFKKHLEQWLNDNKYTQQEFEVARVAIFERAGLSNG